MNGKWIWKLGDFEKYHCSDYLLSREERGTIVPCFYEVPYYSRTVRFSKKVNIPKEEEIKVFSDGQFCLSFDGQRYSYQSSYIIPEGEHTIRVSVCNKSGMCALKIIGENIFTDETWNVDCLNGISSKAVSSPLCAFSKRVPSDYKFPKKKIEIKTDKTSNDERIIDFGKEILAELKIKSSNEINAEVFYGESYGEVFSDRCVIIDKIEKKKNVNLPVRACRYVRFKGSVDFKIEAFYPYLPLKDRSDFKTESILKDIYDTSKYTLELCSRMFFLDGIKRDKWPWNGDAYITAKMNYYSFNDFEIVKRTLNLLRGNYSVISSPNYILEYSFYWFMMLKEYYLFSGDLNFIKDSYESAKELIAFYIKNTDSDGFVPHIPSTWLFIDWHDINRNGAVCVIQMLYCISLKCMAEFAALCKEEEDNKYYTKLYKSLYKKINLCFWDENLGGYVSSIVNGVKTKEIRRHQNYIAVIYGFADKHKTETIIKNVVRNENIPKITTPFFKFFEYDLLCKCGYIKEAFNGIENYWGKMIKLGATTIWEEFDDSMSGEEHYAMYGEPYDKSLCHAWGAGPLYFIGRYVAGVKPESPGYEKFSVSPITDLGNFSAKIPIGGKIVEIIFKDKILTVLSDKSGGKLLFKGKSYPIIPGKEINVTV